MSFEYQINKDGLNFLKTPMPGKMKKAISVGVRNSLAIIERSHKKLFVRGQSKDPTTYPDKLVWRTGTLAKSYISSWKPGQFTGYHGSTLKRSGILEHGGTIRAKKAAYLHFRIGAAWVKVKEVTIRGRFMMKQVEEDKAVLGKISAAMATATLKGIDDAG